VRVSAGQQISVPTRPSSGRSLKADVSAAVFVEGV
jgi:hypothetical protein